MKLHTLLKTTVFSILLLGYHLGYSQFPGCPAVTVTNPQGLANSSNVIDLDCGTSCVDLVADPFHAGETTSYIVESIPHTPPIPYDQPGGNPVSVNIDDRWSSAVNLPFNFCFYGQTYTNCIIGSNGSIKFGTSSAGGYQNWSFSASAPSSALSSVGDIFGIYHDIDPSVTSSGPSIKWYLIGTAPCRILCVVYRNLAHFSCTSKRSTFMMVLYETTNAIDVYVQRKDLCSSWNGGRAIIGIQNPNNASQGVVAPGRNSSPTWTVPASAPEAWRFTPNGAPIYDVNWYVNGSLINTGDTINVCPSVSTVYEAKATYHKCDGTTVEASDFMTVNPPADAPQVDTVVTSPTCLVPTGSVIVSATGGTPPYTYSQDNITYGASGTFPNLSQGNHTFYVKDASGCVSNILANLHAPDTVFLSIDSTANLSCFNDNTGKVFVSATGGSGVYSYSVDGGTSTSVSPITGLTAGTHQITVADNGGCTANGTFDLTQPTEISFMIDYTTPSACNLADGEIYTTVSGGTPPYSYQLNEQTATPNADGDFSNIMGGATYTVTATDAKGCSKTLQAVVPITSVVSSDVVTITPVTCFGANDGQVVLNTTGGTQPYAYEIDDTTIVNTSTISGLTGGSHVIMSSDVYGCVSYDTIQIPEPQPLVVNVSAGDTICVGQTVTISASATGGNSGYQYAWNNGQTSASFTESPSQTTVYSIQVTDAKGCQAGGSVTASVLNQPEPNVAPPYSEGYPGLVVNFTNTSTFATNYLWNFGNGQTANTSSLATQSQTYNEVGDYIVILTASNGICQNMDTALVKIIPLPPSVVTLPNVFSPNGDQINDEMKFIDLKNVAQIEYWVLNRWGNVMFHFKSEDKGYAGVLDTDMKYWDGKINGQNANPGVYFYKYEVKDLNKQHLYGNGFVQLLR